MHAADAPFLRIAPGWIDQLVELLASHDRVDLLCDQSDLPAIGRALQALIAQTFERDYLQVWPMLTGVHRGRDGWRVVIEVRSTGVR
jgi:hypothetical protein